MPQRVGLAEPADGLAEPADGISEPAVRIAETRFPISEGEFKSQVQLETALRSVGATCL
jgi:hypothetical protein